MAEDKRLEDIEQAIRVLDKRKRTLMAQWTAAVEQSGTTLNQADIPVLTAQANSIWSAIEAAGEEIQNLKAKAQELERASQAKVQNSTRSSSSFQPLYQDYSNSWEENLHQIDFSKAKGVLDTIFTNIFEKKLKEKAGAALFLLKESFSKEGKLCIREIQSRLQQIGTWYPPFEMAHNVAKPLDTTSFMAEIAKKFEVGFDVESGQKTPSINEVVDKICGTLSTGHILLIHLEIKSLKPQDKFFCWFIQEFWSALVQKIETQGKAFVRVVAVLSVLNPVGQNILAPEWCCTKQKFESHKILDLPLQNWRQSDIQAWLLKYSRLTTLPQLHQEELTEQKLKDLAATIYDGSNKGRPRDIRDRLLTEMTEIFESIYEGT